MKVCDGKGRCYRRYKKYYFDEYEKVECSYDCVMSPCKNCNMEGPEWYFEQYSSRLCYECNKQIYSDEADSNEDDLRSDATVDSIMSEDEIEEYNNKLYEKFASFTDVMSQIHETIVDIPDYENDGDEEDNDCIDHDDDD